MARTRVTILGGSSAFFPSFADALAQRAADLPRMEIRLFGRNEERLRAVGGFCQRRAEHLGADHAFTWTTDLGKAVAKATIVVNQLRLGGWEGRARDERAFLEHGLPGDETIGPGGLASAVRSAPQLLEIGRTCAERAKGAWFMNLANPLGILCRALAEEPRLRTFGLCELPLLTLRNALATIGVSDTAPGLEYDYAGCNHQGFFPHLTLDGEDLLPRIFTAIEALPEGGDFLVEGHAMRAWQALPLPYFRLYAHTGREVEKLVARARSRGEELGELSTRLYDAFRDSSGRELPKALLSRPMPWFAETIAPAIAALLGGPATEQYVTLECPPELAKRLGGGFRGKTMEHRTRISADGMVPLPLHAFDADHPAAGRILPFLRKVVEFEERALDAARKPSVESLSLALLAHPFGIDVADARRLSGEILANESEAGRAWGGVRT